MTPDFDEEGFFEYHLYTLGRRTTLREKEQKQVTLLEAQEAPRWTKRLIFYGAQSTTTAAATVRCHRTKRSVSISIIMNSKGQRAWRMALPKGVDSGLQGGQERRQAVHRRRLVSITRRGTKKIRIKMGEAFDVVGDRKQMNWTFASGVVGSRHRLGNRAAQSQRQSRDGYHFRTGRRRLGNREPAAILTKRRTPTDFVFNVAVPANGKQKTVTYTVQTRWC